MKHLRVALRAVVLLLAACSGPEESSVTRPALAASRPAPVRPSGSPAATVRAFLTWYRRHQSALNSLPVVPAALDGDTAQVFAVDGVAVERYLRLLRSSGTVSPAYLQAHRRFFQRCADALRARPQRDGIPDDLTYDRVLYTQAGEDQTALVLRSPPTRVMVGADTARVEYRFEERQMSDGRNLAFSLAVEHGRWMITAIRPLD